MAPHDQQNRYSTPMNHPNSSVDHEWKSQSKWCYIGILALLVAVFALVIAVIALLLAVISITSSKVSESQPMTMTRSCPGSNASNAASSCQEILKCNHLANSGDYWIATEENSPLQRFCDMNRVCGGIRGGWMRVAELDMRNGSSECPRGLRESTHPGKKLCGQNLNGASGCSHVFYEINGVSYDKVCGKIIAYQLGSTDAFGLYRPDFPPTFNDTIEEMYLDGISLTYGSSPRKHIWSFAAALDEVGSSKPNNCPCTNTNFSAEATEPPAFVGNDYFCDTASAGQYTNGLFYADNPLWDGAGCGTYNTCCFLNSPPWFFKHLGSAVDENIEMRVCSNEGNLNEDVLIEQIEIFVF